MRQAYDYWQDQPGSLDKWYRSTPIWHQSLSHATRRYISKQRDQWASRWCVLSRRSCDTPPQSHVPTTPNARYKSCLRRRFPSDQTSSIRIESDEREVTRTSVHSSLHLRSETEAHHTQYDQTPLPSESACTDARSRIKPNWKRRHRHPTERPIINANLKTILERQWEANISRRAAQRCANR